MLGDLHLEPEEMGNFHEAQRQVQSNAAQRSSCRGSLRSATPASQQQALHAMSQRPFHGASVLVATASRQQTAGSQAEQHLHPYFCRVSVKRPGLQPGRVCSYVYNVIIRSKLSVALNLAGMRSSHVVPWR